MLSRPLIKIILKQTKEQLLKYKFVIPTESHTNLNGITVGKAVYLMPPLEITFSGYEEFAKSFDRPVIGLNWTKELNEMKNIKQMTKYFVKLLKN